MHKLLFMGREDCVDAVRCRIYGATEKDPRVNFLQTCANEGAIDCPAHDTWVKALQNRKWLPDEPIIENNPNGPGKIGRWHLTDTGRQAWERIKKAYNNG